MADAPKKILLLSDPALGQLNVHLATAHALLNLYPSLQVHVAAHPSAANVVSRLSQRALETCPPAREPVHFHALENAQSQEEAYLLIPRAEVARHLGRNTWRNFLVADKLLNLINPWTKEKFLEAHDDIERVITEVRPDVIAVDPMFAPALTAARNSGIKWHLLMPLSMKDVYIGPDALWRIPLSGTGWPYPLPWYLVPLNILNSLALHLALARGAAWKEKRVFFREKTGKEATLFYIEPVQEGIPGWKALVPSLPEYEYPLRKLDYLVPCGPILQPVRDLKAQDAELDGWLAEGPTVYISLGSHRVMDEEWAVEMARALRLVFDEADSKAEDESEKEGKSELGKLRVLWKLRKTGNQFLSAGRGDVDYDTGKGSTVYEILAKEIDSGRVRIVNWLDADPISVLASGHVVCAVHHGGANSSIEAIAFGVPHVILAGWADCYDWAARIEYLGIGRWGNRKANPDWTTRELGKELIAVVCGPEAAGMKEKARALADRIQKHPPGREVAARTLMEGV